MKKLSALCLAICIMTALCIACLPVSAAEDKYTSANEGDLLYTVDFSGDEYFKPGITSGDPTVDVDPTDHGKATIYTKTNKSKSRWGGEISCLPLNEKTAYTMYYTVTRTANEGALGVYVDDNYGVYGYSYNQRFLNGGSTLTGHPTVKYLDSNINITSVINKDDASTLPSVQEFALEVNGQRCTMKIYIKDNSGSWVKVDETVDDEIIIFYTENFGLYIYSYYADAPVSISNVNIHKGMLISNEKLAEVVDTTTPAPVETTPAPVETTTEAPTTTPAADTTTEKPADTTAAKPADTTTAKPSDEKKGCGSLVALGLIACAVPAALVICRKKH